MKTAAEEERDHVVQVFRAMGFEVPDEPSALRVECHERLPDGTWVVSRTTAPLIRFPRRPKSLP